MNFGLYPGATPGSSSATEGYPLIGQAVEMGYSLANFTTPDGKEYLRSGYAKAYLPKYSTFYTRNPYACSYNIQATEHVAVTGLTVDTANFNYINLANGRHYIIPTEPSATGFEGVFLKSGTSIPSMATNTGTLYSPTAVGGKAQAAVPYGTAYVAVAMTGNANGCVSIFTGANTVSATWSPATAATSIATNGSTSILAMTGSSLSNGNSTNILRGTSTAGGFPATATAVTVTATGIGTIAYSKDALACIPNSSTYLLLGTTNTGSFSVLYIWKSVDIGSNWTSLYLGTLPVLGGGLSSFRAGRNFATNGNIAIFNIPGETNYGASLIWTDGSTVSIIDMSNVLPLGYNLSKGLLSYDSVNNNFILTFYNMSSASTGVFMAVSKDGKNWTPKFNVYPAFPVVAQYARCSRGTTVMFTYYAVNSAYMDTVIDISAYTTKSSPTHINTINPANGNSLSTLYRIA